MLLFEGEYLIIQKKINKDDEMLIYLTICDTHYFYVQSEIKFSSMSIILEVNTLINRILWSNRIITRH